LFALLLQLCFLATYLFFGGARQFANTPLGNSDQKSVFSPLLFSISGKTRGKLFLKKKYIRSSKHYYTDLHNSQIIFIKEIFRKFGENINFSGKWLKL
jgi:hypothetical protein